ncbi:MAG: group 1 truncated hemoglobin [Blastocatellia bacterium]|nr:group 1 truncated hemoglobin [Blastocatellia bacterium]
MRRIFIALTIILAISQISFDRAVAYSANSGADKPAKAKSLYERLGGKKAIAAVVDEFVARVAADDRINSFFADTASDAKRLADFKQKLVDQICQATGGPCKYKGKDMKSAHAGMGVTEAAFGALVEDLIAALDKFKVPEAEKKELLGLLAPMKGDIVEK